MYTVKGQNAYDDEPFHFTPIFDLADIICEGSDTDETPEQIKQKHLRYEANAERCASGRLPVFQSTVLRGPFSSSLVNPWRCESSKAHNEKKCRQSPPDKLSPNGRRVLRKPVISNSEYLCSNDAISWLGISGGGKENEADASEADSEITQLGKERVSGYLSSDRNKERRKIGMQGTGLSYKNNDAMGYRIKRGTKRRRKSHTFININTNEYSNWDNESYSTHESFRHLLETGNTKNGGLEAELLEDQSSLIINQNKKFESRKLFLNSRSSSSSPFSSPIPAPKRQRIKYKTKTYKDKHSDVESDDYDSEDSKSIRLNRNLSIYASIRQNSVITPKTNHISPSTKFTNLKSIDRDIFVTNCAPSSQALEKFVYKTKKRKRDSRGLCDFSDLASLPSENSSHLLARKKKKIRMTQDNEDNFLLLDTVDIQRKRQEFSSDFDYSPNKTSQTTNSNIFSEPQPCKNSNDNNQQYLAGYIQPFSDSTGDIFAWRQDCDNENTPVISQGEKVLSQSFLQNNEEQSLYTTPTPKSKSVVSNDNFLTPDKKSCVPRFTPRFIQKTRAYQENSSKSSPKGSIPEIKNRFRDFLASSVTSLSPQKINPESNIFSISPSNLLTQQQMNQEFSLDMTINESQKVIGTPSLTSLSVPIIFDQQESSPAIQFSTRNTPDSSSLISSARDTSSSSLINQRNSSSQALNPSPCGSRSSQPSKYSDSIMPEMSDSKDCNERCNFSLTQNNEKEFYALEDGKLNENFKQDECKKSTEAPIIEQQEISLSPLMNQKIANNCETFPSSKVGTPHLRILNPVEANCQYSEPNYSIKKINQVITETPTSSENKSQNSGRQSPWASEIQNLTKTSEDMRELHHPTPSSPRQDVINVYISPDTSTIEDKVDPKIPKPNFNTTPEKKITLSLTSNAIETPYLDHQNDCIQKSIESALRNPWKSSIKKQSSIRSKKRVSFQQPTKLKEDLPSEIYSISPPNGSSVGSSPQQPDQIIDPPLSNEVPKKLFSDNIPNLTTLSKSHSHSEATCSPKFSAMAEAFIAADKQTYSEEKEDESSLLKDQIILSSNHNDNDNDNDAGQLVATMTTTTTTMKTKEPNNSNEMNNHDLNTGISTNSNSISGNEQKELQSNCWLDSPSITSLKEIDFSILAAENTNYDPLLSGVEDFLEDWSIDNVLK